MYALSCFTLWRPRGLQPASSKSIATKGFSRKQGFIRRSKMGIAVCQTDTICQASRRILAWSDDRVTIEPEQSLGGH
jgi:hypothetical protein